MLHVTPCKASADPEQAHGRVQACVSTVCCWGRGVQVVMAVFAYLYFNNVVARQTVTVGYMLQKALQLDGVHMLELFTKLGAPLEAVPSTWCDVA